MILAWVTSLLVLISTLVMQLERLTALRIIEIHSQENAQKNFIEAESAIKQCQENITHLSAQISNDCFIEPSGKNIWRITSKQKPSIQIHIFVDEKADVIKRLNWRQVFD
jgi:hypothetical protein